MDYFIHIKTSIPCVVLVNNTQIGYTQKPCDILSFKTDDPLSIVTAHPIENSMSSHISFCATLHYQNKHLLCDSKNVEIYNFCNNHFEIVLSPPQIQCNIFSLPFFTKELENKTMVSVYDFGTTKINLVHEGLSFDFFINEHISDINAESFENNNNIYVYLSGKTNNNLHFLMIFCNFFCNLKLAANKIDFDNEKIECVTNLNDIAEQAVVEQFKISQKGFAKFDEFLIFKNKKPYIEKNEKLIPWAFMEALNYGNISLCRQYLSSELSVMLDDNHIKNFFGNYIKIDWDKYHLGSTTICVFQNLGEKCRKFTFAIDKGKIMNIIELD